MSRKSFSVPRPPSRTSMKPSRKAAAQNERQKTIAQLSGVSMKRAMAPPKLQKSAERKTSRKPRRSSRRETCGGAVGRGGGVGHGSTVGDFRPRRCAPSDAAWKSRRVSQWRRRDPGERDGCGKGRRLRGAVSERCYAVRQEQAMNQTLKNAIREVEALPEAEQEELGRTLLDMALRKKIDARLERSGRRQDASAHAAESAQTIRILIQQIALTRILDADVRRRSMNSGCSSVNLVLSIRRG